MRLSLLHVYMMGVAFTLGLGLGLLLHLPGLHGPVSAGTESPVHGRYARQLAQLPDWIPRYPNRSSFNIPYDGARPVRGNSTNLADTPATRKGLTVELYGASGSEVRRGHPTPGGGGGGEGGRQDLKKVSVLQAKIQHIHNSIDELKTDTKLERKNVNNVRENIQSKQAPSGGPSAALKGNDLPKRAPRRILGGRKVTVTLYKKEDKGDFSGAGRIAGNSRNNQGNPAHNGNPDAIHLSLGGSPSQKQLSQQFRTLSDVVQGVYWSETLELLTPCGFSSDDVASWRRQVDVSRVWDMQQGCGRMQNRKLTLGDASVKACARYRFNADQMQGEIYSYYLGKLLGIQNIPPSVLALPDIKDPKWTAVVDGIHGAEWSSDKVVLLTPWIYSLQSTYIPRELRTSSGSLRNSFDLIANRTLDDLLELVQWSDLIVFDYLTANVDRVVNNMYNLQWNHDMMASPAHNLEKSAKSNMLVFLDNESGLFHSYRLLDKYSQFHDQLLRSLCIFRKSTADAIESFHKSKSIGQDLERLYTTGEPLHHVLPKMSAKNMATLQSRVDDVYKQIQHCKSLPTV